MNNCKIATSIEQSKSLFAVGINPMSADMVWRITDNKESYHLTIPTDKDLYNVNDVPAWSSAKLGIILPSFIRIKPNNEELKKTNSNNEKPKTDNLCCAEVYRLRSYKRGNDYYIEYYNEYKPLEPPLIGFSTEMDDECEDEVDCKVSILFDLIKKGLLKVPVNCV